VESIIIPSPCVRSTTRKFVSFFALAIAATGLTSEQVPVIYKQGAIHGFLLLKDENGKEIAAGDQTNEVHGSVIHARTIFRFRDGSVDDEETVYRQEITFQLLRDHHVQKGPSFPNPVDVTIDVLKGEVSWVDASSKGAQAKSQHKHLPRDLANGMVPLLVENFRHSAAELKVSYLAIAAKPRVVKLTIKPDGTDKVLLGGSGRQADRFDVHFELGGIAGAVAPLVGKQPPDIAVWTVDGTDAPVPEFIKLVGPLYESGPIWTVLLAAPTWLTQDTKN
jgi:hypothetical protein